MATARETIWDGRGDRLVDARWTMLPGRAADDTRLGAMHMRLLLHMGRQNAQRGWLRLSQTELAEAWSVSRPRLNEAIRDLVAWHYVEKRGQDESGETFCLYRVSEKDPPDEVAHSLSTWGVDDEGGVPSREHPPGGCPAQGTPVSPPGNTGVPYKDTLPIKPILAESPPPTPRTERHEDGAGDATWVGEEGQQSAGSGQPATIEPGHGVGRTPPAYHRRWTREALDAVAEIRASVTRSAVATALLDEVAPLLGPPADVDAAAYVRQIAAKVGGATPRVLAAVAEALIATRKRDLPAVSDIDGLARVAAARLAGAVTAAAPPPADDLVEIGPDDPLFPVLIAEAQLAMEAIDPAMARRVAERRVVRIRRSDLAGRRAALAAAAQPALPLPEVRP